MVVKKERFLNVGGLDVDDKVVQGVIKFLESGQIVITSVNTDDERSVTFALADPLNVNIASPDPLPTILEDGDGDLLAINADGSLNITDWDLEVAKGNVANHSCVSKFGRNDTVGTTPEIIWSEATTPYPWIVNAGTASVVSADADDDGDPVGDGARTVTIEGLNPSWTAQSEIITMNGTTPVVTSGSWKRINRMFVATVGSSEVNEGLIQATVDGNVVAEIPALKGQSFMAIYTIPDAVKGYLWEPWIAVHKKQSAAVEYELFLRENADESDAPFRSKFSAAAQSDGQTLAWRPRTRAPLKLVGPCDIYMIASASTSGVDISAGFDITLVAD
jgi:hypothetical protein